jgi:hypothetical protein
VKVTFCRTIKLCYEAYETAAEVELMKYLLFWNRQQSVEKGFSHNNGIDDVLLNPEAFRYDGHPLQLVDTASFREEDRKSAYLEKAMWPATAHHYQVKAMFGTGIYGGIFFGSVVPALVIESDSGEVMDVYPHRKFNREVTIREVLTES